MSEAFKAFFSQATGKPVPYAYQQRLAEEPCISRLISVPTGLGKTAAVVLAWLWNRRQPNPTWPRRLVYCLPMRTLVEQTYSEAKKWLEAHQLLWDGKTESRKSKVGLHILMGGEEAEPWDLYPEEDAILIGTQDMLLSRALNRGYGMSRYRWPMHFGLLNNDCLWVLDETQLMGPGLSTACQLEAFRSDSAEMFGSWPHNNSVTWYASATVNADLLKTREWRRLQPRPDSFIFDLMDEKNAASGPIAERLGASKTLTLRPSASFGAKDKQPDAALISEIVQRHREMVNSLSAAPASVPRRSLVICNTVDRAMRVHHAIKADLGDSQAEDLLLMHSRFRPHERKAQAQKLKADHLANFPAGQIIIATQVIEAGVDVSSGMLWSEVAPLACIVQRLGRLNRSGEFGFNGNARYDHSPEAIVLGIDGPNPRDGAKRSQKQMEEDATAAAIAYLPYDWEKCQDTFTALKSVKTDVSPRHLEVIQSQIQASIQPCPYSLQRHELLDFFDTDANLSLGFTDVSPFVRGLDDDTDLQVVWRETWVQDNGEGGTGKPDFSPDFQRDELCSVPISKALKAREVLNHGWLWRGKESGWISVRDSGLAPGMTILLPVEAGGYDMEAGWTGDKRDNKHSPCYERREAPSDEDQLSSLFNGWQSIEEHTRFVAQELQDLLQHLRLNAETECNALTHAVPWHDIGKNHPGWQEAVVTALAEAAITGKEAHKPFAKFSLSQSPLIRDENDKPRFTGKELGHELKKLSRHFKPSASHEVASALAFRQAEQERLGLERDTDLASLLAEYVIMSHHGRVRKVLRDEIPRYPDSEKDTNAVRGVTHGEGLPSVTIDGQSYGCDSLSTDCRKMGRGTDGHESYTRGVLRLLDHYGPFRLAFFEALFRAADIRASIKATSNSHT